MKRFQNRFQHSNHQHLVAARGRGHVQIYKVQRDYVLKQIEQHENSFDEETPRDYIDVYLTEMNKNEADSNFTKIDLAVSMLDFLHAGTETSSTTLKWILLYLSLYQDVQDKLV